MDIDNDSLLYRIASYDERIGLCSILFHMYDMVLDTLLLACCKSVMFDPNSNTLIYSIIVPWGNDVNGQV